MIHQNMDLDSICDSPITNKTLAHTTMMAAVCALTLLLLAGQSCFGFSIHPQAPRQKVSSAVLYAQSDEATTQVSSGSHFFSRKSLADKSFVYDDPQVFQNLCSSAGIERPSKIQAIAWSALNQQDRTTQHSIIADQTGSGKTYAYSFPLLQRIDRKLRSNIASPQILILAPTSELADQIHTVISRLDYASTVLTASGGFATNIRDQIRLLQSNPRMEVLVSTPGRIATILRTRQCESRILSLKHCRAVVFDEVDILLLDSSFAPQLETIGNAVAEYSPQFVFCTATLPDAVTDTILAQFPNIQMLKGAGLHKIAPTVQDRLVDVSTADPKDGLPVKHQAVLNALRLNRCRRTLIFCNTVVHTRSVVNAIERHDRNSELYEACSYHNAMTIPSRQAALKTFMAATDTTKSYILVCTDRAARGVELGIVDHIIIFDFGSSPAEYMRRVGRTARAGRSGSVTVLAYGWQLPIARQLMTTSPKQKQQQALDEGMFAKDEEDDDKNEEWSFRKKKRSKNTPKATNYIGSSIATGKVWTEKG